MLVLYNVRKGQIINQSREDRKAKKKADDARELCQLPQDDFFVEENVPLETEQPANNSLFYRVMKEGWDQHQLLAEI